MSEASQDAPVQGERSQSAGDWGVGDWVLGGLFAALVIGSAAALAYDFRSLLHQEQAFQTGTPARVDFGPATRPGRDDQVRRYDPRSAPARRGDQPVELPGFDGDLDVATGASITFHLGEDGQASAVGRIDPGSFVAFERFIDDHPDLTEMTLHSPGGSVRDAIAMAELIRAREIGTRVARHGYCASSCPLAFSGGVDRAVGDPAWFGVHQVFTSDAQIGTLQDGMAGAQLISSQAQTLLDEMGVDPRAWIDAMATPKEQLYLFTQEELAELNWVTEES